MSNDDSPQVPPQTPPDPSPLPDSTPQENVPEIAPRRKGKNYNKALSKRRKQLAGECRTVAEQLLDEVKDQTLKAQDRCALVRAAALLIDRGETLDRKPDEEIQGAGLAISLQARLEQTEMQRLLGLVAARGPVTLALPPIPGQSAVSPIGRGLAPRVRPCPIPIRKSTPSPCSDDDDPGNADQER